MATAQMHMEASYFHGQLDQSNGGRQARATTSTATVWWLQWHPRQRIRRLGSGPLHGDDDSSTASVSSLPKSTSAVRNDNLDSEHGCPSTTFLVAAVQRHPRWRTSLYVRSQNCIDKTTTPAANVAQRRDMPGGLSSMLEARAVSRREAMPEPRWRCRCRRIPIARSSYLHRDHRLPCRAPRDRPRSATAVNSAAARLPEGYGGANGNDAVASCQERRGDASEDDVAASLPESCEDDDQTTPPGDTKVPRAAAVPCHRAATSRWQPEAHAHMSMLHAEAPPVHLR
jgi:hypothetical protein